VEFFVHFLSYFLLKLKNNKNLLYTLFGIVSKETLKNNKFITKSFAEKTIENINASLKYKSIEFEYEKLISTQS